MLTSDKVIRSLAVLVILIAPLAAACSCSSRTVEQAKAEAHVVFRGKIVDFRESEKLGRIAVFRVDRVWKGAVSKTVEMLTFEGACYGFWTDLLRKGDELLVYGRGSESLYATDLCTRTAFAKDNPDIYELGKGTRPK